MILPEFCGQTPSVFKPSDYQYVTKLSNFYNFCQDFLPISTYPATPLTACPKQLVGRPKSLKEVHVDFLHSQSMTSGTRIRLFRLSFD